MKKFKDLVAGDKVVVKNKVDGNTIIFVAKVERVTHRSIYACTVRFSRKNGRMIGEKSGSHTCIEIASEEVIEKMEAVLERKRLSGYLQSYDFYGLLSLEKLQKIIDIIKE